MTQAHQETPQALCIFFQSLFRRIALHDHWCVEYELPTACVIPPYTTSLGECSCTPEETAQDG